MKRGFRLRGVVFPAEELKQFIVPGLDAEADPVHSRVSKHGRLANRHAARVRLHGPFSKRRQIETLAKSAEKKLQLRRGERRGRAATDENCFRRERNSAARSIQFLQERLAESLRLRAIGALFIECTIRANPRAKRNVNVDVRDGVWSWGFYPVVNR